VEAGLVEPSVAAEMLSSLSDDGKGPTAQPTGGAAPASSSPQPQAAAPDAQRKSRSLF
jgi:hypothetical protein